MKTKYILLTAIFFISSIFSYAQKDLIKSGPMLGYSDFREVLVWLQTTKETKISIKYTDSKGETKITAPVFTKEENKYIAKIYPGPLNYGEKYKYEVLVNDKPVSFDYDLEFESLQLWQYRMDPPEFSFAIGSCFYMNEAKDDRPGRPYGSSYKIFNSILKKDPNFMVWLGDNVYLRVPDFLTERGLNYRYSKTRSLPELQPLLGSVHHYAIWDDHDYGPNDSNSSYVNKRITEKLFNDYWGNLNTNVVGNGGITGQFLWNDVEFFLLDNRYHRDPNELKNEDKSYFGKKQMDWLINALASSKAAFKIVVTGGQIVSDVALYENYAIYKKERETLLNRLHDNRIEGVLFFTGDRHHTEISKLDRKKAYPLIDITCSPLTSGTHKPKNENNSYLIKDKTFYERNFGIVNISGPRKDRVFTLTIHNADGEKAWDYTIKAKDLRYPKKK